MFTSALEKYQLGAPEVHKAQNRAGGYKKEESAYPSWDGVRFTGGRRKNAMMGRTSGKARRWDCVSLVSDGSLSRN